MENNFLKLYPQYKNQKNSSNTSDFRLNFQQKKIDQTLQSDISRVREIYKDFLTPISDIKSEVDRLDLKTKDKHQTRHLLFSAMSPISPLRRISSLPDNIEDGNFERALGLVGLALVNLPEDTRDLKSACKQIFKGELPKYDYKNYQHPFSFFRGTALEPIVNKMGRAGVWLHEMDKSLYHTKFGKYIRNKLKIDISDIDTTGRRVPEIVSDECGKTKIEKIGVKAYKLKGKYFSKLIGRALLRIPIISVLALSFIELPSIVKSFKKENKIKENIVNILHQTLKSGINIASISTGIGIVGALLARKGPAGSLLGMGLGSVSGAYVSNFINNKINK